MINNGYMPTGFSLTKEDIKKIDDLMTLTKIHNRSYLIRLLIDYFIENKDKISELMKNEKK